MAQTVSPDKKHERVNYAISCVKTSGIRKAPSTEDAHIQNRRRCIYCGQVAPLVWVHGHGQCASCGINVDECCRGESCFNNEE